mmetsp:Transcript_21012/g.38915  ORF Transcript_21012/g.38915 Transcript_21012/m.38915 type:complete len:104 (+) Transcript_21012:52-363(+)
MGIRGSLTSVRVKRSYSIILFNISSSLSSSSSSSSSSPNPYPPIHASNNSHILRQFGKCHHRTTVLTCRCNASTDKASPYKALRVRCCEPDSLALTAQAYCEA